MSSLLSFSMVPVRSLTFITFYIEIVTADDTVLVTKFEMLG